MSEHHPQCKCVECEATRAFDDYWGSDEDWERLGKEAMSTEEFDRIDKHMTAAESRDKFLNHMAGDMGLDDIGRERLGKWYDASRQERKAIP